MMTIRVRRARMKTLHPSARPHLLAAEGWLELGNPREANEELEKIQPRLRAHPNVLEVRWRIYAAAGRWDACLDLAVAVTKLDPRRRSGWFHYATTIHRLGRAEEAREVLLSAVDSLGDDSAFFYELARLCCLLRRVEEERLHRWIFSPPHACHTFAYSIFRRIVRRMFSRRASIFWTVQWFKPPSLAGFPA
jgi:predicted Zn-dependent protease